MLFSASLPAVVQSPSKQDDNAQWQCGRRRECKSAMTSPQHQGTEGVRS
jgi:hypothetical protein